MYLESKRVYKDVIAVSPVEREEQPIRILVLKACFAGAQHCVGIGSDRRVRTFCTAKHCC
jgi:hypothetical protein